jgi:hypothetical protein
MLKITHNKVKMTVKRKALVKAASYYAKRLKIEKHDVTLCICFKHDLTKTFSVYAQVDRINDRRINLEIDAKIHNDIALDILAHEMVHVKQYLKNELGADSEGFQIWKGSRVVDGLSYTEQPWEREAMKKQVIMKYEYVNFRDLIK